MWQQRRPVFPLTGSRRTAALAVAVAAVVVPLSLALMVSNGAAAGMVAANARSLHWTNTMLGSAAVSRAATAQAVVFAVDHELGVASDSALDVAVTEATQAIEELEQRAQRPPPDADIDPDLEAAIDGFLEVTRQVLTLIEAGQVEEAVELSQGELEVVYRQLEKILADEQTRHSEAIAETESAVGRIASLARMAVTLLIPATAILLYFVLARRQMREQRSVMEAQLEAARQLAQAKDEFIAGISHELRTPLTAIYGFSEVLLESGLVDPNQALELIGVINGESAELSRMVEDLLTAARLDAEALTFDISELSLAPEIETVLQPFLRLGADVTVACEQVMVRADRLRLRQVLRNLISNAHHHGGPTIRIETLVDGDHLKLAVIDDGPGVPPEIEDRLFEPFVHDGRNALLVGSVGLGLSVARTLTEGMGGVLAYQRVDGDTVFTLTLPVATFDEGSAREAPPDSYESGRLDQGEHTLQLVHGGRE